MSGQAAARRGPPEQGGAGRTSAMVAVLLGVAMASLDTSIANTALPAMARDLGTGAAQSVWIVSAYQLAMVGALLPAASLGEIVGHQRVFIVGLVIFVLAALGCGLAPTLDWLVAGRVVQGLGAAGLMSVNGALVRFIYPPHMLGRGIGLTSLVVGVAFAAGPTVASAVLALADWHWLFLINVPTGLLALGLALRYLPETPRSARRFDALAALLSAGFLAGLIYVLNGAAQRMPWPQLTLAAALVAGCLFTLLRRQAEDPAPMLAMDLLRLPVFRLSAMTGISAFATQAIAFISLPFMFQGVLGYTAVETGLLITPWPLVVAVMGPLAGRLSDRYPPGLMAGVGLAAMALGMAALALLPADPSVVDIAWRLAVCGAGFGLFQSPNVRALMGAAPVERSGGASGMVGTVRLAGQSIGAALVAACFNASASGGAVLALWLGAGCAALAAGTSVMRLKYAGDAPRGS